ncbi:hypothetical protein RB195_002698 [Necator americanus]|uniref:Uncharacterized protein n=1 Tax=Necator americanus TaxID=51031 RepID=A0ABR1DLM9_NECAM
MNMQNGLKEELNDRVRSVWPALAPAREATDQLADQDFVPISSAQQFFQRSVTQKRYAQTPLPRPQSYLLLTDSSKDAFYLNRHTRHQAGLRDSDFRESYRHHENIYRKQSIDELVTL